MDHPFNAPVISVCTGLRGLERGIERALGKPLRVATYVEVETFIIENLLAGMEAGLVDAAPVWANLKTFDAKPFHGKIGGIIGGYPCPGESLAGLRELHKYHGWLWPYLRNVIDAVRPFYCYFENVAAHVTGTYPIVYRSLRRMGYAVEAGIYTAQEVGAPHLRERLFILALDNASLHRLKQEYKVSAGRHCTKLNGEAMAHTNDLAWRLSNWKGWNGSSQIIRGSEVVAETDGKRKRKSSVQHKPIIANTNGEERNAELDHAECEGFQRRYSEIYSTRFEGSERVPTAWPSYPGQSQKNWEEPRTVEPGMGCTVNGYNFREDLLRAFGNSVVEQTAELAFVDLLNKFIKPH